MINKKGKKPSKMKTTINIAAKKAILIVSLFLISNIQLVMAKSPSTGTSRNSFDIAALAPETPKEATFDDVIPEKPPVMVSIAPVTPKEATFEDEESTPEISTEFLKEVAPETPKEADFEDAAADTDKNIQLIIFRAPVEALFVDF
jgi:hypothetical protein